jgi:RHS repeat-associated protein
MPKTTYVWDELSDNVIEEYEDGVLSVSYTHEPGLYGNLLSQNRSGVTSYYHYDGRGDTVALTDDSGNITDARDYDAWGNVIASSGSTIAPYQFGGRSGYQAGSTTAYVRARVYQPANARWMSLDFLRSFVESNWYSFAINSPISRIDPTGLFSSSADGVSVTLGCNDLSSIELNDLGGCGPGKTNCGCSVWKVGPRNDLPNQTIEDPFNDIRVIAQPVCFGGELIVKVNPNRIPKMEEDPYNIPNPLGLMELYNRLGISKCIIAHEMHHIAQYNCFCPDLCKNQDGPVSISDGCTRIAECWAYSGQSNCMIKAACAAFHRGGLGGLSPNQLEKERFDEIMKIIDFWGEFAQNRFCNKYADIRDITKNARNWSELRAGRPCRPAAGL